MSLKPPIKLHRTTAVDGDGLWQDKPPGASKPNLMPPIPAGRPYCRLRSSARLNVH